MFYHLRRAMREKKMRYRKEIIDEIIIEYLFIPKLDSCLAKII